MGWREWFALFTDGYFQVSIKGEEKRLTEEDRYQAFIARWNEEEYPKLKARLIEELQTNNSGLIGKLEERDGK